MKKDEEISPCPFCGHTIACLNGSWLQELEALVVRHSHLGIAPDIASLSLIEAWGLHQWLIRLGG